MGIKVVCIDNKISHNISSIELVFNEEDLTIGKVYDAVDDGFHYVIVNDIGEETTYLKRRFKDLYTIRNEKINLILK